MVKKAWMIWVTEHLFGENDILVKEFLHIPGALRPAPAQTTPWPASTHSPEYDLDMGHYAIQYAI